jgi:metal-dependent HD superfamily phosphatase/phosphodiesterase
MLNLNIPAGDNRKLKKIVGRVNKSAELEQYLVCSNVNVIDRMGYNDHGPVHVKIVANIALKILRVLLKSGIKPGIVKDHKMKNDDAEVVVVLAAILHDIGHFVHRENHEGYSLWIAMNLLDKGGLLDGIYRGKDKATIISETLHAIISHKKKVTPLTVEGGVIKISDALDMAEGRSRIPFSAGTVNIHSVSAMAIQGITIKEGKEKPVELHVKMTNSAGIFQVDELLRGKVKNSGLQDYIKVIAEVERKRERSIVERYEF